MTLAADVHQYVTTCPACQQMKVFPARGARTLQPIPPSSIPWEEITADLIVELPQSQGFNAIFIVVDHFTKHAHFIPTTLNLSAEGATKIFHDRVWTQHGWPKKIIMDRGTQFTVKFAIAVNKSIGIQTALSIAYHLQTNGQTEHINQDLEQYLCLYTNYMQDDWSDWLAPAKFAYNNHEHSSTKSSRFFLEYG